MNAHVTVLCLGDIFGRPGRKIVKEHLPKLISDYQIDFVVANGENVAGGKGLNIKCANELFDAGVDVLTNGNHLMDNREILTLLEEDKRVIRPWNMKEKTPGSGFAVIQKNNVRYAVVNFMGTVLMPHDFSAFDRLDEKVRFIKGVSDICIVDMHAEASSEMRVMGFCWDGKASVVFGTHTHVPTADAEILQHGTAYITDVGMTGPYDSVIGVRKDMAMHRIMFGEKRGFEVAKGDVRLYGLLCKIDPKTSKAIEIEQIIIKENAA